VKNHVKALTKLLKDAAAASTRFSEAMSKLSKAITAPHSPLFIDSTTEIKRCFYEKAEEAQRLRSGCEGVGNNLKELYASLQTSKVYMKLQRDKLRAEAAKAGETYQASHSEKKGKTGKPQDRDAFKEAETAFKVGLTKFREKETLVIEKYQQGIQAAATALKPITAKLATPIYRTPNASTATPTPPSKAGLGKLSNKVSLALFQRRLD
jgi:hypothetical protein